MRMIWLYLFIVVCKRWECKTESGYLNLMLFTKYENARRQVWSFVFIVVLKGWKCTPKRVVIYIYCCLQKMILQTENFDYLYLLLFSKYENASRKVWLLIFNPFCKRWEWFGYIYLLLFSKDENATRKVVI